MTTIPALIARRLRTVTELAERERMLADKTAAARGGLSRFDERIG